MTCPSKSGSLAVDVNEFLPYAKKKKKIENRGHIDYQCKTIYIVTLVNEKKKFG
jgi:hypothetical protein